MGCWNGTCMISNLPIMSGDKIKLVLLSNSPGNEYMSSGGYCYATGLMAPAFFAISGEYDDYGNIENIVTDWNYELISDILKKRYKRIKFEDKDLTEFTLEDIINGIERDNLEVIRNKDVMRAEDQEFVIGDLCFVMIRQDVWDGICAEYNGNFWNENKEETDKGNYYISTKEWCKRRLDKCMKSLDEFYAIQDEQKKFLHVMTRSEDHIFDVHREIGRLTFSNYQYRDLFNQRDSDKESIFKAWTEHIIINSFLDSTRKAWMITQGKGSQSASWEDYKVLNKIVDKICDEQIAEYGEE